MAKDKIISYAADKSGLPLPPDKETIRFSEGFLRNLDDGIGWVRGEKPMNKGLKEMMRDLQKEQETIADTYVKALADGYFLNYLSDSSDE